MAGFITLPQAIMSVVGGVPVNPASAQTIVEKMRVAKSMMPGDIGGLLGQVLQNGPGAILQNPIGSMLGQMQGGVGGLVSQIQGIGGSGLGGLLGALNGSGGLMGALGSLSGVTSALSGLTTPGEGMFGLMDALGHANLTQLLGANMPSNLNLTTAMGPILMGGQLTGMAGQITAMSSALTGGTLNAGVAAGDVAGMTGQINSVMAASANAFSTVQGQALGMAGVMSAVSMLANNTGGLGPIANLIIQPQHMGAIQAALSEQIR